MCTYVRYFYLSIHPSFIWRMPLCKYCLFYRTLLQKRPIIWRSLLIDTEWHTSDERWMNRYIEISYVRALQHIYMYVHFGRALLQNSPAKCIHRTYVHINTCVCTFGRAYIRTFMRAYIRTFMCAYIFKYIHQMVDRLIDWCVDTFIRTCKLMYIYVYTCMHTYVHANSRTYTYIHQMADTGWGWPIGCLKSQVIFRKSATAYRALLRKLTYKDKASCRSSPPCA